MNTKRIAISIIIRAMLIMLWPLEVGATLLLRLEMTEIDRLAQIRDGLRVARYQCGKLMVNPNSYRG